MQNTVNSSANTILAGSLEFFGTKKTFKLFLLQNNNDESAHYGCEQRQTFSRVIKTNPSLSRTTLLFLIC